MDADSGLLVPSGMTGIATGLGGGTNRVYERVGGRVRKRCSSISQPGFVLTDFAFEFTSLCMAWIVAYIGFPSISGIAGFSKLSMSLSTEVAAIVGGKN